VSRIQSPLSIKPLEGAVKPFRLTKLALSPRAPDREGRHFDFRDLLLPDFWPNTNTYLINADVGIFVWAPLAFSAFSWLRKRHRQCTLEISAPGNARSTFSRFIWGFPCSLRHLIIALLGISIDVAPADSSCLCCQSCCDLRSAPGVLTREHARSLSSPAAAAVLRLLAKFTHPRSSKQSNRKQDLFEKQQVDK